MTNSVSQELDLVKQLINEYKYDEALQNVNNIKQNENLTPVEALRILKYRTRIYYSLGKLDPALNSAEELYQKSQKIKMPLYSLDALYSKSGIFHIQGRIKEMYETFEQHEKLFKLIPREESTEFQEREAFLFYNKGLGDYYKGNLDHALDCYKKSLTFFEQFDPHSYFIIPILMAMAYPYQSKGELKLALECNEKALSLIPDREFFNLMLIKATIYLSIGEIYFAKGDMNNALEYFIRCQEIYEKYEIHEWPQYDKIIGVLAWKKDFTQARNYLQKYKQFIEKHDSKQNKMWYQFTRSLILKASSRMRDRAEAEYILKKIIEEHSTLFAFFSIDRVLIALCGLYFEEFRLFNQMDILDDIHPLVDHLQKNARQQNSYLLLAHVKLLQAKLALLQINMVGARKLLTEAQNIADEHDLQLLAGEISKEHDRLLEELKLWESIKKTQASVAERLKLASIDDVLERMQGRRALESLESSGQQPVSLLILAEGGVLLFSYPFTDEWKQDHDLFGSFLSAFLTFSDEFFSQGLDRAKFGKETILLQSVGSFSICYLFRGQTYFAKQKLEKFVKTIQKDSVIWETLEKFEKSSQVADLKDLPKMEGLLNEVFLS